MTTQVDQNRGEDGQLAHQATPTAVGHEADNLDYLKATAEKAMYDLFYSAMEAGEDEVLQRQFEHEPAYKHRYAKRCINEATTAVIDLVIEIRERSRRVANPPSTRPMTLRQQLEAIFTEYDKPSTTKTYPGQKTRIRRGAALDEIEAIFQGVAREAAIAETELQEKMCHELSFTEYEKWAAGHKAELTQKPPTTGAA